MKSLRIALRQGTVSLCALSLLIAAGAAAGAGFPSAACRAGFAQIGTRLCISILQDAAQFDTAMYRCRNMRAYVASYGDLYYLYRSTALDANYNPNGRWLGPDLIADDRAFYGNRDITVNGDPDQENFEGTANKNDLRPYWCAHDRE